MAAQEKSDDKTMMESPTNAVCVPHRYAVYFAPNRASAWWKLGSEWLGRDARTGALLTQPSISGVTADELRAITHAPRRYGWHATLKAPFSLAPHSDVEALRATLRAECRKVQPFQLPTLRVGKVDDFLALVTEPDAIEIQAQQALLNIAMNCVKALQPFAAPLSTSELERRRNAGLTPVQVAYLTQWGYPFVLDQFRFHISLTGSLKRTSQLAAAAMLDAARSRFESIPAAQFEGVTLFSEATAGSDFVVVEDFGFGK
jgi:putative phosphonate metabolism protein